MPLDKTRTIPANEPSVRSEFRHSCKILTAFGLLDAEPDCGIPDWYYADKPKPKMKRRRIWYPEDDGEWTKKT